MTCKNINKPINYGELGLRIMFLSAPYKTFMEKNIVY